MRRLPLSIALLLSSAFSLAFATTPVPLGPLAQGFDAGSTGADGALAVTTADRTFDLATEGAYDPTLPAVIFNFTSVTVNQFRNVRFLNHPSRCPVIWRVQGNVTINGAVWVNGVNSTSGGIYTEPGPGGFRGGVGGAASNSSAGFGWGGGGKGLTTAAACGSHATTGLQSGGVLPGPTYGSPTCFPLIGGSGGGGRDGSIGGGAGGGAILIAANGTISVSSTGAIWAYGGDAGFPSDAEGAGGMVRLVADRVDLLGNVNAGAAVGSATGPAGKGRVRIEANIYNTPATTVPPASFSQTGPGPVLPPASSPRVEVVSISNNNESKVVPSDPRANFAGADVVMSFAGNAVAHLKAYNVTPGKVCQVKVTNTLGDFAIYTSSPLNANLEATAAIVLPNGISTVLARINLLQ